MKSSKRKKTTPAAVQIHPKANPTQEVFAPQAHYEPAVPMASIVVVYNSRTTFVESSITELAQSIAAQGLLQPISLMQKEERYILVAGERRFRACSQLGHTTISALVRPWDEKTFLSLQLIENLQREDLPPLEEAQGFAHMLQNGYSVEELTHLSGKSRSFVEKRLQLTHLIADWKTGIQDGSLSLSSALEIARLPEAAQEKLYKLAGDSLSEDGYSARHLSALIERRILLNLSTAAFDKTDSELWTQAGSCQHCQKHTACQQFLFTEYETENDQCLDAECYSQKTQLHYLKLLEKLRTEYPDLLLVCSYKNDNFPYPDVVSYPHWRRATQETEGALPALEVSAYSIEFKPTIFYVTLRTTENTADNPPTHAQTIRENKIKRTTKLLVFEGLLEKDKYRLIDFYLKEHMPSSKATVEWLVKEQGFSEPDADRFDYKKREQWVTDNTREWTFEEKVFLYLTIKLRDGLHDKDNTHVREVAKFLDHDMQPYIKQATELVDAPKPKKERKAKKEKAQSPVLEPPSAEELPSRLRLRIQTEEQLQNAA